MTKLDHMTSTIKKIEVDYVENIFQFEIDYIAIITLSNKQNIITTPDHPFYIIDYNSFACVNPNISGIMHSDNKPSYETIKIGQKCLLYDQQTMSQSIITDINCKLLTNPISVYTFVTKKYHNYFANGILVHNKDVEFSAPDVEKKKYHKDR